MPLSNFEKRQLKCSLFFVLCEMLCHIYIFICDLTSAIDWSIAGADYFDHYTVAITSYDYDAPLTEAGDITDKYLAIRNMSSQVCSAGQS